MYDSDPLVRIVEHLVNPSKSFLAPESVIAILALVVSALGLITNYLLYWHRLNKDSKDESRRIRLTIFSVLFLTPHLLNLREFFRVFEQQISELPNGHTTIGKRSEINESIVKSQEDLKREFIDLLTAFDHDLFTAVNEKIAALVDEGTRLLVDTDPSPKGSQIKDLLREKSRRTNAEVLAKFYSFDPELARPLL